MNGVLQWSNSQGNCSCTVKSVLHKASTNIHSDNTRKSWHLRYTEKCWHLYYSENLDISATWRSLCNEDAGLYLQLLLSFVHC